MAEKFKLDKYFSTPVTLNIVAWLSLSFLIFWVINPGDQTLEFKAILFASLCIFSTLPFFLTTLWLIPKLLFKRKFFVLILATLATLIICALICMYGSLYAMSYFIPFDDILPSSEYVIYYLFIYCWNAILGAFSSGAITLFYSKKNIEYQFANIESEKTEAELAFLKGQINPHFLIAVMDTLQDNITEEAEKVQESVVTFKNLLNYQLFECTNDEIDIAKEIKYLESYIMVQSNRMEVGSDIQLNTNGKLIDFNIAPLLILPLIENAFKHVSHYNESSRNKIHVDISREKHSEIVIKVSNTCEDSSGARHLVNVGGIGLVNLKRRLELLYTNSHTFSTKTVNGLFTAELSLLIS